MADGNNYDGAIQAADNAVSSASQRYDDAKRTSEQATDSLAKPDALKAFISAGSELARPGRGGQDEPG